VLLCVRVAVLAVDNQAALVYLDVDVLLHVDTGQLYATFRP
jgi:hypothetical protein